MKEQRKSSGYFLTPLLFSGVLVTGMVWGFNLKDSLSNKRDLKTVVNRNDRVEELIGLIKERYVDTVNTNKLYERAVNGILDPLDPHTVYIPAEDLQGVNEDLEGAFSGIGVEYSIINDTLFVTNVIAGGPSERAGLEIGDQVIRVGDSVIAGNGINTERILKLLRGKEGSKVAIAIRKPTTGGNRMVSIKRGMIPLYSVDAGIMLDEQTGYIKINKFSATTYDEFKEALERLQNNGAQQLVLDLRDNPGGYMDAAISILDDLLPGEKLLVYTKGVHTPRINYTAELDGLFEHGKLAVLINENSASASEIVSGAVQDWDRGVVVGRRSFGKGLVQEQFELPDGSAIMLTTARYYTPSGRSIQRPYKEGREAYEHDAEKRWESGELVGKASTSTLTDTIPYYTANKRVVHGGGGIIPDVQVPYDTTKWSSASPHIAFSETMNNTVLGYYIAHKEELVYKDVQDFVKRFDNVPAILQAYLAKLSGTKKQQAQKIISADNGFLSNEIKAQVARYLYRDNGYYAVKAQRDDVLKKAMEALKDKAYVRLLQPCAAKQMAARR